MTDAWRYELTSQATKDLRQLDVATRRRILNALDLLAAAPYAGDVRKLSGSDEWRLRVGDIRVRFLRDTSTKTIVVRRVLPRDRAYGR